MSLEQDFFKPANQCRLKYQLNYRCKRCGMWIKKENAVFTFFTKISQHQAKQKVVNSKCPRCPECHYKLKTRPTVRKLGRQVLEKGFVRY